MGFSSEYLYCFHYPNSLGYLIFCCHGVARSITAYFDCFLKASIALKMSTSAVSLDHSSQKSIVALLGSYWEVSIRILLGNRLAVTNYEGASPMSNIGSISA